MDQHKARLLPDHKAELKVHQQKGDHRLLAPVLHGVQIAVLSQAAPNQAVPRQAALNQVARNRVAVRLRRRVIAQTPPRVPVLQLARHRSLVKPGKALRAAVLAEHNPLHRPAVNQLR